MHDNCRRLAAAVGADMFRTGLFAFFLYVASAVAFSFPSQHTVNTLPQKFYSSVEVPCKLRICHPKMIPRTRCFSLRAKEDEVDSESSRRDELLKKLASTDLPKSANKSTVKKDPELPTWFYIAVPLSGALLALAVQYFSNKPLPVG